MYQYGTHDSTRDMAIALRDESVARDAMLYRQVEHKRLWGWLPASWIDMEAWCRANHEEYRRLKRAREMRIEQAEDELSNALRAAGNSFWGLCLNPHLPGFDKAVRRFVNKWGIKAALYYCPGSTPEKKAAYTARWPQDIQEQTKAAK